MNAGSALDQHLIGAGLLRFSGIYLNRCAQPAHRIGSQETIHAI